jgi:hypothetical protein
VPRRVAALITVGAAIAVGWIAPTSAASAAGASPHRAPTVAAARRSANEAAAAIDEITGTRPSSGNPLADIPPDFAQVMGYQPALGALANGDVIAINPNGGCSVIGGGEPFDLATVCKAHDLGYDLLRYAHRRGRTLSTTYRMQVDTKFADDLSVQCAADYRGAKVSACNAMAETFVAGVGFNSWRQQYGPPIQSSGTVRTIGVLAFGALVLFFAGRALVLGAVRIRRRQSPRITPVLATNL